MLQKAQTNNWFRGFKVSSREESNMTITHLQYADDTLIFCEADLNQVGMLRVIFILFEAISGLHINWNKSFIYPLMKWDLQRLSDILGGRIGYLPTTYLGLPLVAKASL